jgi:hypothetical protein
MGKLGVCSALALVMAFFPIQFAAAGDHQQCKNYAEFAVDMAKSVRDGPTKGCGLNLKDISLSTNYDVQYRWCLGVANETAFRRYNELWLQNRKCGFCEYYASKVVEFGVVNVRHQCGFANTKDPRWTPKFDLHFNGCMGLQLTEQDSSVTVIINNISSEFGHYDFSGLEQVLGEMALDVYECKKKQPFPVGVCKTCHETQKPTALLPAALRPPPKRGSSGHDFSVARQPPSFKPEGSSSGENDQANPPGERRRNPRGSRGTSSGDSDQVQRGAPNPCGSELKPCKPSRIMTPGLLDGGGGGGGTQGPAATGSPIQAAPPQFQRGSGGGGSGLR